MLKILRRLFESFLPISFSRYAMQVYGLLRRPINSYSQKGEDILINVFFKNKKDGFYLDIGCFHPKWISNTHSLHNKGWSGYAVDLDDYKLDFFRKYRGKRVKTLKKAVVGKKSNKKVRTVYKFRTKLGWSDIDTLDKETADLKKKTGWGDYICEEIEIIDINSLLSQFEQVDFLNIDVEGMDVEIIHAIDFKRFKIPLIVFEDTKNYGGSDATVKVLQSNIYKHLFTSGGSVGFFLEKGLQFK